MITRDEVEQIAERAAEQAVKATLLSIGVDVANPIAAQRDFSVLRQITTLAMDSEFRKDLEHTRKWRKAVEGIQSKGVMTIVGALVTGTIGIMIVGLQQFFGRH